MLASAIAAAVVVLTAVSAVVTNYATVEVPTWFQDPTHVWLTLVGVVLAICLLMILPSWVGSSIAPPHEASDAESALERAVKEQWDRELRVRMLARPAPMPVEWQVVQDAKRVEPGAQARRVVSSSLLGARSDQIELLAQDFFGSFRGRLVLLGEAGAGKTTLAGQLVVQLLRTRGPQDPIPVLFSLTQWDARSVPELWTWIKARLSLEYPFLDGLGETVVSDLVDRRRILPVLDGLDELPAVTRPDAVEALNSSLGPDDGLILTSRAREFREAAATSEVLTGGIWLEAQPLDRDGIANYLESCARSSNREAIFSLSRDLRNGDRWEIEKACSRALGLWLLRTVYVDGSQSSASLDGLGERGSPALDELYGQLIPSLLAQDLRLQHAMPDRDRNPGHRFGIGQDEAAQAISSGLAELTRGLDERDLRWWELRWRLRGAPSAARWSSLFLGALAGFAAGAVLGAFVVNAAIGSVMRTLGYPRGQIEDVTTSVLAAALVLGFVIGIAVGAASSLCPEQFAGPTWFLAVCGALAGALPVARPIDTLLFGPIGTMMEKAGATETAVSNVQNLFVGIIPLVGMVSGAVAGAKCARRWHRPEPVRVNIRLRGRSRSLFRSLAPGLVLGVLLGYLVVDTLLRGVGAPAWLATAVGAVAVALCVLATTALYAVAYGLAAWSREPSAVDPAATPRGTLCDDRRFTQLQAGLWLFFGFLVFTFFWVSSSAPSVLTQSLLLIGVAGGLVCLLARSAWVGYVVAATRLWATRRGPLHLSGFLEEAHRLGLLRAVGSTYQFRHESLQDYLSALEVKS